MSGFLGLLFPGGGSGGLPPVTPSVYIAYSGTSPSPTTKISVYNWNSSTGFGSRFTSPSISLNTVLVSFVRDNSIFSSTLSGSPFFGVWQWSGLGFGTQYSGPASPLSPSTGAPVGMCWTDNVDALLSANYTGPSYPQAWAWSAGSGFGTKYSNGTAYTTGSISTAMTLNGDNTQVAFSHSQSPFISMFPWSSSTGFGTKYANPTSAAYGSANLQNISFNRVTNDIAITGNSVPYITAYPVTALGFGTRYGNPSTFIGGVPYCCRFAPNGSVIAVGNNATPAAVKVYQWGGGFGSLYSSPSVTVTVQTLDWSSTTTEIAIGIPTLTPPTRVYSWSTSGFGAQYSNPATAPVNPQCVSFSNQSR